MLIEHVIDIKFLRPRIWLAKLPLDHKIPERLPESKGNYPSVRLVKREDTTKMVG